MANDDLVSIKEAADLTGYHHEYIRQLIIEKKLTARKFGNAWAVSRESVLAYLKEAQESGDRRHGPKSERSPLDKA
jgi:excisionase family DNA binding protein